MLVPLLRSQRGRMGDLWVIAASCRTTAWARTACNAVGPNGTRIGVEPIVLLVGPEEVEALLDEGRPSLAFFAAWAVHRRHGPEAEQVGEPPDRGCRRPPLRSRERPTPATRREDGGGHLVAQRPAGAHLRQSAMAPPPSVTLNPLRFARISPWHALRSPAPHAHAGAR